MGESSEAAHFETLQVRPTAEPEVIEAAYRALAKKYHPDRSSAPDAETHMARINAAFQAIKGHGGRQTGANEGRVATAKVSATRRPSQERIDPTAPLEVTLATVTRMAATARQRVLDEVTNEGIARDLAANLVATAFRALLAGGPDSSGRQGRATGAGLDPTSSYAEAVQVVTQKAQGMRDQLTEQLMKDGLNRGAALELADAAFERIRRSPRNGAASESRLTPEHVDLTGPLDSGVGIVGAKLRIARQMVVDELTRDGIPLRTAEQLVEAAGQISAGQRRR